MSSFSWPALAAATLASLSLGASAHAAVIYQNNFSLNAAGFSGAAPNTAPSGERFLGPLAGGAEAVLTVDTTGLSSVTLTFDLYGILSIDGGAAGSGGDSFRTSVDGGPVLLDETFSNFGFQVQTFGPGVLDIGRTGSDTSLYGHLGYHFRPDLYPSDGKDTTYHFSYTFAPTGASTTLRFAALTSSGTDDESFGIDNVVVSTPGGVPEPAAWALMILGFGAAGASLRRRKPSCSLT